MIVLALVIISYLCLGWSEYSIYMIKKNEEYPNYYAIDIVKCVVRPLVIIVSAPYLITL